MIFILVHPIASQPLYQPRLVTAFKRHSSTILLGAQSKMPFTMSEDVLRCREGIYAHSFVRRPSYHFNGYIRMTKMIVVCAGDKNTKFDREYYATKHLALAKECWGKYGLEAADAFFPAGDGDGWMSIGIYRFREASNIDVALASPETERVMADVKNFTDTTVVIRSVFSPL